MDTFRGEKMKLSIELVPKTSWYNNVRSNVSGEEWDTIRKKSYRLANYRCEICGDIGTNQGVKHAVECHEIFDYTDEGKQVLTQFISLCPRCHKCKHPGLANIRGESEIVLEHLMKVNSLSEDDANAYLDDAFDEWAERSTREWDLDISYIEKFKEL